MAWGWWPCGLKSATSRNCPLSLSRIIEKKIPARHRWNKSHLLTLHIGIEPVDSTALIELRQWAGVNEFGRLVFGELGIAISQVIDDGLNRAFNSIRLYRHFLSINPGLLQRLSMLYLQDISNNPH